MIIYKLSIGLPNSLGSADGICVECQTTDDCGNLKVCKLNKCETA